ncbi:MAG: protein phosphatase 2C domain-containing protein [Cytophagaceae bacterium]|nr:protein phosphatase 2C domain-containing protein [Cytophagaceae bacterium]
MLNYTFQIADSVGGRTEQQDAAGTATTRFGLLVLVCDGMGGTRGGATASRMAVDLIQKSVQNASGSDATAALVSAIRQANHEIYQRSQHDEALRGMGTTVTALLLQESHATLCHAGDSRIYHLRKGKIIHRTFDHSKVFELVRRGILSEEQARLSEDSNVILRALGIKPDIDVEVHDQQPYQKGDRFLLCTDGISGAIPEEQLLAWAETNEPVETAAPSLIRQVDQAGFQRGGGHDNLTVALVECRSSAKAAGSGFVVSTRWLLPGLLLALLGMAAGYIGYDVLGRHPQLRTQIQGLETKNAQLRQQVARLQRQQDSLLSLTKPKRVSLPRTDP